MHNLKNVVEWFSICETDSEAMSDEIVTATACGASIFLFELFKKNLESISRPSYEMNEGSWQAGVLIT